MNLKDKFSKSTLLIAGILIILLVFLVFALLFLKANPQSTNTPQNSNNASDTSTVSVILTVPPDNKVQTSEYSGKYVSFNKLANYTVNESESSSVRKAAMSCDKGTPKTYKVVANDDAKAYLKIYVCDKTSVRDNTSWAKKYFQTSTFSDDEKYSNVSYDSKSIQLLRRFGLTGSYAKFSFKQDSNSTSQDSIFELYFVDNIATQQEPMSVLIEQSGFGNNQPKTLNDYETLLGNMSVVIPSVSPTPKP